MNIVGTKESAHDPTNEVDCGAMIGWMESYNGNITDVLSLADYLGADLVAYVGDMYDNGAAAQAEQPGRYSCYEQQYIYANVVAHETGGHNFQLDHRDCVLNPKTVMLHNYCTGGSNGFYSNPNIWLNGIKLLGIGSCLGGTAGAAGDNTYLLSTTAQGRADAYERRVWGSNLYPIVKRWQFNTAAGAAPAGTVIADSIGGAQAIVRGQGATFTGTGLRLPGGTSGNTAANSIAAYIDLPNGIFSALPNFTIEIWATPITGSNWMRIIDIGRTVEAGDGLGAAGEYTGTAGSPAPGATTGSDQIGLTAATGSTSLNNQRLIVGVDGTYQIADSTLGTTAGEMHHYAITFADTTSGAVVKWFRDGALIKTLTTTFHSAQLEDVNNWLGRSLWSGDTQANIDCHDVRIIGAALADGQIAGNYRIGPHDAKATMWANDAFNNSAFVSGAWEFGGTPVATRDYEVGTMLLRSPRNASNVTFPGKSLGITGGNFNLDATGTRTVTVTDLRLNGGATIGAYTSAGTQTLAGNINAKNFTDNTIRGNTALIVSATITGGVGGGGITYVENGTTLTGNNTGYLGATIIGDGRFSTLRISNETQLGGNPTYYGGAWLQLNRGILQTTATMTIDDANRGILIGTSAGFFRPDAGTTLTIATTINSPAAGNTLQTAPLDSNPIVGMFFKDGAGTLVLTSPNNSHNGEMQILDGILRIDGGGRLNNGDHFMPITLNSTLNYNSTAAQILRGVMSGTGTLLKNNTGTLSINGSNTFSGSVTVNAGTLYANPGNAATNRAFSYVSGITVNSGGTLKAGLNGLFGWDGTQAKPVTVNAGGTMTTDAAGTDVNVGTVTLNGGTLAGFASTTWGSWTLKRVSGAKLNVTDNSTVSAPNVGLGTGNSIDVTAGKTLTFSGTITDLSSEGVCALVKSSGTGTLILTNTNTYTGATTVNAGTLLVNGSITASATTVASGATLGGTGTVGSVTINSGGTLAPGASVGTFTTAATTLNGTLAIEIASAASADRLNASGAVTLGGALTVTAPAGLPAGTAFTILNKTSAGAIGGIFTGKPQDSVFTAGGNSWVVSYTGGDGNDITLTVATALQLWRYTYFNTAAGTGNAADTFDANSDGELNLMEFATAQNPTAATSTVPTLIRNGANLEFTYTRSLAAMNDGVTFTIEWRDELPIGTWSGAGVTEQILTNNGTVQTVKASVAAGAGNTRYLHLKVTKP